MTISRLLRFPVTLITRTSGSGEDEWGSPVVTESRTDTVCYYEHAESSDPDEAGTTSSSVLDVFVAADLDVTDVDAVELDAGGGVAEYEVVGDPNYVLNARLGTVNHITLRVRKAAA